MSIDLNPTSPIAIRFLHDLQLNDKGTRTQQSYGRALRRFTEFLKREPDTATEQDLRNYILYIKNELHWTASTINVAQCGLKHFFKFTCPRDWPTLKLLRVKTEAKIPVVLSIPEVHTLLKLIEKPSMQCFFHTVYSMGMRLQEALHLQVADIDSRRMLVHIHRGKGAKDRLIPLPPSALDLLRSYYRSHRNPVWIPSARALHCTRRCDRGGRNKLVVEPRGLLHSRAGRFADLSRQVQSRNETMRSRG